MKSFLKKMLVAAVAVVAYAGTASAGFEVTVYSNNNPGSGSSSSPFKFSDGTSVYTVSGNPPGTTGGLPQPPSGIPDSISNPTVPMFNGYAFDLTALVTNAGANGKTVSLSININRVTGPANTTFTIVVSRTNLAQPPDPTKAISDALTLQTTSSGAGSSTYRSFVSPMGVDVDPNAIYKQTANDSGLYGPVLIAGSPNQVVGISPPTRFGSAVNNYVITTITTLTFNSGTSTTIQLTSSTTVQSIPGIPAPAGLLLAGLGLPAIAFARRFRRPVVA